MDCSDIIPAKAWAAYDRALIAHRDSIAEAIRLLRDAHDDGVQAAMEVAATQDTSEGEAADCVRYVREKLGRIVGL
jgi:hypothetical protein